MLEQLGSCKQQDLVYDSSAGDAPPLPPPPAAPCLLPLAPPPPPPPPLPPQTRPATPLSPSAAAEKRREEDVNGEFECPICDRRFRGRASVRQHLMWQHRASQDKVDRKTENLVPIQVSGRLRPQGAPVGWPCHGDGVSYWAALYTRYR